jgi:hypothetical protein
MASVEIEKGITEGQGENPEATVIRADGKAGGRTDRGAGRQRRSGGA